MKRYIVLLQFVLLACAACLFLSCGKKADPFLSIQVAPEPVKRFRAVVRPDTVILLWKAPRQNTDDTDLLDLSGFYILREGVPREKACPACPRNFQQIHDLDYAGTRGQKPERDWFRYYDRRVKEGYIYAYAIQCYNERGVRGPNSKIVPVVYAVPSAAPEGVAIERRYRLLDITWDSPVHLADGSPAEDIIGYNVYRSSRPGMTEQFPLNQELVTDTFYEDVPEKYDVTYYYSIRAVRQVEQTLIESEPSAEQVIAYHDIVPPSVPQMLTAIPTKEGMLLKWRPKTERDFAGFNIYRREPGDEAFEQINTSLITDSSWVDTSVEIRGLYIYAVTSVDASAEANESELSEPVEVKYILK